MGFLREKLGPRRDLLATVFVRRPVKPVWLDTRGVLITSEERDLSFLLTGNETEGKTAGVSTFPLLEGKTFAITSCKL